MENTEQPEKQSGETTENTENDNRSSTSANSLTKSGSQDIISNELEHSSKEKLQAKQPLEDSQLLGQNSMAISSKSQTTVPSSNENLKHSLTQAAPQLTIEQQLHKSNRDLESMVCNYAKSERENLMNKNKVEELDKKLKRAIKDNDQLANRIKLLTQDKNHLTDTLNAKVAQLTVLEEKNSFLNNVQGVKLKQYEEKINKLEESNEDLLKQVESYKSKEGELLDFSERLSMKHMMLQSELEAAMNKAPSFKEQYETTVNEKNELASRCEELINENKTLSDNLKAQEETFDQYKAERVECELKFKSTLDELQNELKVTRRKHQNATRELLKEIKQLKSQLDKTSTNGTSPILIT